MPGSADSGKVKALENKVDSLTAQLAEAIALLKAGNNNKTVNNHDDNKVS